MEESPHVVFDELNSGRADIATRKLEQLKMGDEELQLRKPTYIGIVQTYVRSDSTNGNNSATNNNAADTITATKVPALEDIHFDTARTKDTQQGGIT